MTPPYNPGGGGQAVEAVVKWFNTTKGFGFVAVSDGSEAFLHMSALEAAGLPAPMEGATLRCEIGPGKKGPQVTRVHNVSGGGAPTRGPGTGRTASIDAALLANTVDVEGSVKWFSPEKGYGFIIPDEPGDNIYFNSECLRRSGIGSVDAEVRVLVSYATTHKGREARALRLL